jgi:beta-exotoxin I transport system permease protein
MPLRNPYTKALWDARRGVIGWTVAIGAVALLYSVYYPAVSQPAMVNALKAYPETLKEAFGFQDMTSPAGYLGSTVFGLLVPVLLAVYTIVAGSRSIAGDEEAGLLDLVLAHPVSRTRLLLGRLGALWTAVVVMSAVVLLLVYAVSGPAKLSSLGFGYLAAASAQLVLFGICIGTLTLAIGAATGRRGAAIAAGTVVAVLGYFANNLGPQVHALAWTQRLSPFYYYLSGHPLVNGLQPLDCLVLAGAAVLFTALGLVAFDRRDVAV